MAENNQSSLMIGMKVKLEIIEMSINPPKITAMGFFDIGPKLFATVSMTFTTTIYQILTNVVSYSLPG